ncbi:hypothetical protein [Streptomyces sp. NPDC093094]|uniref:hypothetical protein n=1 Tax=Streptomyces sp. NPDC093094 TaxID=3366026 RepID=UPI003824B4C7
MPHELSTPEQFHAFAETIARELGAHWRTAPVTGHEGRPGRRLMDGEGGVLLLYRPDNHRPELLKISRTTAPARSPAPQAEARARRAVAQAVAAALPGTRTDEQPRQTLVTRQGAGFPAGRRAGVTVGPWGDRAQTEGSGRLGEAVTVLVAFARAVTTGSVSIPGDVADAFTGAFSGTVTADVAAVLGCAEVDALAGLLHALGAEDTAREWTDVHAQDDEPGERHFSGTVPAGVSLAADQMRWSPPPVRPEEDGTPGEPAGARSGPQG